LAEHNTDPFQSAYSPSHVRVPEWSKPFEMPDGRPSWVGSEGMASLKNRAAIDQVVGTFAFNIHRYLSLPELLDVLPGQGVLVDRADAYARATVAKTKCLESPAGGRFDEGTESEIAKLRDAYLNFSERGSTTLGAYTHLLAPVIMPSDFIDGLPTQPEVQIFYNLHIPIRTLMATQIVGVWATFETLATDLWVASLNARPRSLACLSGFPQRIGRAAEGKPAHGGKSQDNSDDGKSISLDRLARLTRGTFDTRQLMGDLLRRRFAFTTLTGIRKAYSSAFSEREKKLQTKGIDAALSSSSLSALAATRNLIVHRGGNVDDEYRVDMLNAPNAPLMTRAMLWDLDGPFVRQLIDPVIICCNDLITAVDEWLHEKGPAHDLPRRGT